VVRKAEAGWYRGDFHVHTHASDGVYPAGVIVDMARSEGLDFVAITDHNTLAALSELEAPGNLLVIPGVEVTLEAGDFNVFGVQGRQAWMEHVCTGQPRIALGGGYATATDLMRGTAAAGLLNSINHPLLPPWNWRYAETELGYVHCLEIWNDPNWPDNRRGNPGAVALWTAWLNAGHRITGIGGSDYHSPRDAKDGKGIQRLGLPSTYVYAQELSTQGILDGLRRRRVYVSTGPRVTFLARAGGLDYQIGDDLGQAGGEIEFLATVEAGPSAGHARIVKNGEVAAESSIRDGEARLAWRASAESAGSDWYRLEVLDGDGQLLAITNPVFAGAARTPALRRYADFQSWE
jgi:hypothetical protein